MTETRAALTEMTLARMKEFYREPGAVFWAFGFPVLLAVALGIAFRNRPPDPARVGVATASDVLWLQAALATPEIKVVLTGTPAEVEAAAREGKVDLVVSVAAGRALSYRYDADNSAGHLARLVVDNALQRAAGRLDALESADQTVHEPGSRYIDYLMPGIIGMNVMGSSMWGIGYTIVWERKKRLLKRLVATPMRRSSYLLSYLLSRLIFLIVEVAALLLFAYFVFDVTIQGSLFGVAVVALLGLLGFSGLSLLVASRVQSIEAVTGWMNLAMLPMWLLSGSFFSYERFPEIIHPLVRLLPLTAINDGLRAIMSRGAALSAVVPEMVVLALWAVLSFLVALKIFRWE
ncbi:MAG: ABC transporter permease [Deltaproteobacteria bacterium]|nr:ABC transporter permease [Deltaproteobacteria bacterium]